VLGVHRVHLVHGAEPTHRAGSPWPSGTTRADRVRRGTQMICIAWTANATRIASPQIRARMISIRVLTWPP
jgi:hypothetical protein